MIAVPPQTDSYYCFSIRCDDPAARGCWPHGAAPGNSKHKATPHSGQTPYMKDFLPVRADIIAKILKLSFLLALS